MYNYFMLIGTIVKDIEIKEVEDGKKVVGLVLAVQRPFASMDGTYATDFFHISLWEFLADYAQEKLKTGLKVAIKGRLLPKLITLESGAKIYNYNLIGERVFDMTNYPSQIEIPRENMPEKEENDQ